MSGDAAMAGVVASRALSAAVRKRVRMGRVWAGEGLGSSEKWGGLAIADQCGVAAGAGGGLISDRLNLGGILTGKYWAQIWKSRH